MKKDDFHCLRCASENTSAFSALFRIISTAKPAFGAIDCLITVVIAFLAFTVGGVLIAFFTALLIGRNSTVSEIIAILLVIVAPLLYIFRRVKNIRLQGEFWQRDIERCDNSWMCLKCCNIWTAQIHK
jgi:uncharacterized protein YggT (Ycf19 family)